MASTSREHKLAQRMSTTVYYILYLHNVAKLNCFLSSSLRCWSLTRHGLLIADVMQTPNLAAMCLRVLCVCRLVYLDSFRRFIVLLVFGVARHHSHWSHLLYLQLSSHRSCWCLGIIYIYLGYMERIAFATRPGDKQHYCVCKLCVCARVYLTFGGVTEEGNQRKNKAKRKIAKERAACESGKVFQWNSTA